MPTDAEATGADGDATMDDDVTRRAEVSIFHTVLAHGCCGCLTATSERRARVAIYLLCLGHATKLVYEHVDRSMCIYFSSIDNTATILNPVGRYH